MKHAFQKRSRWPVLALGLTLFLGPPGHGANGHGQDGVTSVEAALEEAGLWLDRGAGVLAMPADVLQREELLEYLIVAPNGATHESLFRTEVPPSTVNAGLLLLGVEPGQNAWWEELGEDEDGLPERRLHPPSGGGFYLYAAWREGEETYLFRIEDLVANLATGRSLGRHRWVYLGSRFETLKDGREGFMADVDGNLVNLSFFFHHNTLLTAAREECLQQTIWIANAWLVPPQGQPVRILFAREPMETLPAGWAERLPRVEPPVEDVEDPAR
jgi:hypothetical protein